MKTKLAIPKHQIEWLVNRLHVSISDDAIREYIAKRATSAVWTPATIRKAQEYAVKHHHKNKALYQHVTRGF